MLGIRRDLPSKERFRNVAFLVTAGFFFFFNGAESAIAQVNFEGEWVNVDRGARSVSLNKLVISEVDSYKTVEAWEKGNPKDMEWGATALNLFGKTSSDKSPRFALAVWELGTSTKYATLTVAGDKLTVDIFTIFRDKSGRANYRDRDIMRRTAKPPVESIADPINVTEGYDSGQAPLSSDSLAQTFIAKYSLISSVDVFLKKVGKEPLYDYITMSISTEDGRVCVKRSETVEYDGWLRFDLSPRGLQVVPGKKLIVSLSGTGRKAFAWRYSIDGYAYGEMLRSGTAANYDYLFRVNSAPTFAAKNEKKVDAPFYGSMARPEVRSLFSEIQIKPACEEAKKSGKIVIVDFYAVWCGPCKKLDAITWNDGGVTKWINKRAVPIKIDADKNKDLVRRYRISAYPTILFLNSSGEEIARLIGYRDPAMFLSEVRQLFGE